MTYCAERGIPHSRFLEEWGDEDRAKLMAHLVEKALTCTLCGTAEWEWHEDRFAYEPIIETCIGCQQKDLVKDEANMPGASIVLVPKATAAKMRAGDRRKIGARKRRD